MNTVPDQTESATKQWIHWTVTTDANRIAWVAIDCPNRSTNTLSTGALGELGEVVDELQRLQPRGAVFHSNKPSGFIVGADVSEFKDLQDPIDTAGKIDRVHELFARIERLPFPTLASIHGHCLGGGLELALACRYRVALDDGATRLGLPEVLLGIHPGFGGTVRLIETVGVLQAFDLMLTGRNLDAGRAQKAGLVDRAVPQRHLDNAIVKLIFQGSKARSRRLVDKVLNSPLVRPVVATVLRRQVAKRAPEKHYPAPYAMIRLWRQHGGDRSAMFRAEAKSISELFVSATSRNLQRLFFLQEQLKTIGRDVNFPVQHVHVIGAGTMGGDIAAWCAMRGLKVTLQDRELQYVAPAIKRALATFKTRVRDRYRRQAVQDNFIIDIEGKGIAKADVIIEAIIEDLDIKRSLFQEIEKVAKPSALIATNTSSIRLEEIAKGMSDPNRLVGVHFFNPVAKMQLIEIIGAANTQQLQLDRAAAFALMIDRQPLPAMSSPGFLINRILSPYLQEAMAMVDEGISPVVIDKVATEFGMPMGPIELADTVGLDICLSVGQVLAEKLGGSVPQSLLGKVQSRQLGRKTKQGFYRYQGKKIIRPKLEETDVPHADIRDRMVLRLLNESVACLREGVVADADLLDVGMVFGTGFAPFRGGPINYANERGVADIRSRLMLLSAKYGERFTPDPGWETLAL
ncbi:MAG: 3-hydroxyacyl-CoA dehydrogenase/enoyl-CoA hydratase/3-hydroxybutyryl-CoA epimerase [Gammaproteobacteria bacterium]|jgi:3-hydroxyacyl-CoA dehydrogenase/enoyl-CoA hydratase/3-hydroxybutyryl-CoA epimerase